MKTKKLSQKLSLKKVTVSSLDSGILVNVKGGAPWTDVCTTTCYTADTFCECGSDYRCSMEPYYDCIPLGETEYPPHCDNSIEPHCVTP